MGDSRGSGRQNRGYRPSANFSATLILELDGPLATVRKCQWYDLDFEAANDAQQSVARLERLLEGSGVEIKVVPLTLPTRR